MKLGKERSFFLVLESQAEVAVRAAKAFREMVHDFGNLATHAERIAQIEHEGDLLTHDLQNRIASTFITPLDKEDLKDLSQTLDDITDMIEAVSARAVLYRLKDPRQDLVPLADLLVKVTELVHKSISMLQTTLKTHKGMASILEEIHFVENESDRNFRAALANLFDEPDADPLMVIKWKEVFDRVETAVDKCETIANIMETVLVKYA